MTIASLIVDIGANVANLKTGVDQVNTQLDSVMSTVGKVGAAFGIAFGAGEVIAFGKKIVEFGDRMSDLKDRVGVGVEALQGLDYVAIGAGTNVETLTEQFAKLTVKLMEGDKNASKGMEALGLNTKDYLALSPEKRIFEIADATGKLGDENERNQVLFDLFGKRFLELAPLMNSELKKMVDHAPVISKEDIEAMGKFNDGLEQTERSLMIWTVHIVDAARGAFLMTETLKTNTQRVQEADDAYKSFIDTAHKMANPLKTTDLQVKSIADDTDELARVQFEMNLQLTKSVAANEAHVKALKATTDATEAAGKALNDYYMKNIERADEMAQATQKAAEEAGDALNSYMLKAIEVDAALEALLLHNAQVTEEWERAVHDDMARNEHSMKAHVVTVTELWDRFNDDLHDSSKSFTQSVMGLYDGFANKLTGLFSAHFGGHGFLSNILNSGLSTLLGPAGPLSGLIQAGIQKLGELAIEGAKKLWGKIQSIFGNDEEAREVNPKRDKFLSQFGGPGTGPGSGFNELAVMLSNLTGEPDGSHFFQDLVRADKMSSFRSAAQAIVDLLSANGISADMNFAMGGRVPRTGAAFLHEGERVQSQSEVSEFRQMVGEMRGLRADILGFMNTSQTRMRAQAQIWAGQGRSSA